MRDWEHTEQIKLESREPTFVAASLPALDVAQDLQSARLTRLVSDRFWITQVSNVGVGVVSTLLITQTILSSRCREQHRRYIRSPVGLATASRVLVILYLGGRVAVAYLDLRSCLTFCDSRLTRTRLRFDARGVFPPQNVMLLFFQRNLQRCGIGAPVRVVDG